MLYQCHLGGNVQKRDFRKKALPKVYRVNEDPFKQIDRTFSKYNQRFLFVNYVYKNISCLPWL